MPLRMRPFRGVRYNSKLPLQQLVAPPYDVISPELQAELMARHAHNSVGLDFNPNCQKTNHTAAQQLMGQWLGDGTLAQDDTPAYYLYSQEWVEKGHTIIRKGIIGAILLDDDADTLSDGHTTKAATILPHERTIHQYITERINLYADTNANLSPIFLMGNDPTCTIETELFEGDFAKKQSWHKVTDDDGVIHRFAAVTDGNAIELILQVMIEQRLLIADGHHRFRTALTLKQQARKAYAQQHGTEPPLGELPTDYLMAFVTNMADPGLVVYPTHRVLHSLPAGWTKERLLERLSVMFKTVDDGEFTKDASTIRLHVGGTTKVLRLGDPDKHLADLAAPLRKLDAAILDHLVFTGLLNTEAQDLKTSGLLGFERSKKQMLTQLSGGHALLAFELHAPPVSLVDNICKSGLLMPQKSTYFYPKLLTGLVFYPYGTPQGANTGLLKSAVPKASNLPAELLPAGVALLDKAPVTA